MRVSIFVGVILVLFGFVFLYQTRNGFLMSSIANFTYAPPDNPDELAAAFDALAAQPSLTDGVSLGAVAAARLACVRQLSGHRAGAAASTAFQRMNLMFLGAGMRGHAPVIDPEAHRMAEIQGGITNDTRAWRESEMSSREQKRLREIIATLSDQKHPAYADLERNGGFGSYDFSIMTDAMLAAGPEFQACVAANRR